MKESIVECNFDWETVFKKTRTMDRKVVSVDNSSDESYHHSARDELPFIKFIEVTSMTNRVADLRFVRIGEDFIQVSNRVAFHK